MVRFAHLADCHVGCWREPKLRSLSNQAFIKAVDECLSSRVDFVVISGDLFHTAIPSIDVVRLVVSQLQRLRSSGVRVYAIAGSHDYSPTGKTILEVLSDANLLTLVYEPSFSERGVSLKVFEDESGVKLCGISGRAGQLDKSIYESLLPVSVSGPSVFLFHTALSELKLPVDSPSACLLPEGFSYYAGGHVHVVDELVVSGRNNIVYPGPLFPASFSELESLTGGFYVVDLGVSVSKRRINLIIKPVVSVVVDVNDIKSSEVFDKCLSCVPDVTDSIVLLRLRGVLSEGRISDVDFSLLFDELVRKGAYCVLKNTTGVSSKYFDDNKVVSKSEEEVVSELISANPASFLSSEQEKKLYFSLFKALSVESLDGETKNDFEQRIISAAEKLLFPDDVIVTSSKDLS